MKASSLSLLLSIIVLGCVAAPASADTIAITNASFEITNPLNISCGAGCAWNTGPIPGWTTTGGQQGSWMPNSTYFSSPVPDGSIVAYSNLGGTISQTLADSLVANTSYVLSVDIGHRLDGWVTDYTIALYAGGTLLDSLSGSNGVIPAGTFATESFTFDSGTTPASGNLGIKLTSAGSQTDFDNVRLTASPVPEPGSLALLAAGLGLTILVLRRR